MYIAYHKEKFIEAVNLDELSSHFEIQVTKEGTVYFEGVKDTISYNMKEFTQQEVYRDFVRNRMNRFVKHLYKGEKL